MSETSRARVEAFKRAWHEADAEGDHGNRVARGLIAADAVKAHMETARDGVKGDRRSRKIAPWRDSVENVIVYRWGDWFGSRRIMIANQDNGASEEVLENRLMHCATPWSRGIAERYFEAHPIEMEINEGGKQ